jgi:hypothetical protein
MRHALAGWPQIDYAIKPVKNRQNARFKTDDLNDSMVCQQ